MTAEVDASWEAEVLRPEQESSYVGTLPKYEDEEAPVQSASRRHLSLVAVIQTLEEECVKFESYDMSAKAAELSLRKRVGSLAVIRNALESVVEIAAEERALQGPIAPYLAGVYLWLDGVAEALGPLARQLNGMHPNWGAFRETLGEVGWLYEMTIAEQRRIEGSEAFSGTALGEALDGLFVDLVLFKAMLNEPFG